MFVPLLRLVSLCPSTTPLPASEVSHLFIQWYIRCGTHIGTSVGELDPQMALDARMSSSKRLLFEQSCAIRDWNGKRCRLLFASTSSRKALWSWLSAWVCVCVCLCHTLYSWISRLDSSSWCCRSKTISLYLVYRCSTISLCRCDSWRHKMETVSSQPTRHKTQQTLSKS